MKSSMSPICHFSENSREPITRMSFWQPKLTVHRQTQNSCLRTTAWWDVTQAEVIICQNKQELTHQEMFHSCGNQVKKKNSHAAIFEVKFGKKAEGSIIDSRERTADTLFSDLESIAFAIKDKFAPAHCIRDTKERQLVTKSVFKRLLCCACHLHHERAMKSPLRVRQFFKKVL